MLKFLPALIFLVLAMSAHAHEVRPGYLELNETSLRVYQVVWKVPVKGGAVLPMSTELPEQCVQQSPLASRMVTGALLNQWSVACADGMNQGVIRIEGLQNTLTDVLLRINHIGGSTETIRLTADLNHYTVQGEQSGLRVAWTYLELGVEHILLGVDHLLFVLALLFLVRTLRRLVVTITAFTIAHSLTLAAAVLGWVHVPQTPVEAVIALSIMFVAVEVLHSQKGRGGLTSQMPWIAAFVFGLLHGFGFAGALLEIGLPENAIPLALAFFNIGVELGQLAFVAVVVISAWLIHKTKVFPLQPVEIFLTYAIGILAAYWTIERVTNFWI